MPTTGCVSRRRAIDPKNFASPNANTAPSYATIHPPRPVGVRATPTAREVLERSRAAPPLTVRTRPARSTAKVGVHADGPGVATGRVGAVGGGGNATPKNRGPVMRPSRRASASENELTLYELRKRPLSSRAPAITTGLYV